MRITGFTLCLSMAVSVTLLSQSTIRGNISDANGSLPYATITIDENDKGTVANENGDYTFIDVPSGIHTITASYLGYQKLSRSITIDPNEHLELDFQLITENIFDEVVISGTLKPTYVSQSPIKIDVISAKQLNTYIPAAASSIVESVSLINGVQEVVACGVCFTNNISINGLQGAYTAILMDGTPMYGNLASVYGLNGIPNMIVDRVEVIKGPSSTLYGSEAVAGVINIITKDPADQSGISLDIMGTSHQEVFGNMAWAPRFGGTTGYIGVNLARIPRYEDDNKDGFGDGALMDRLSVFTKWNVGRGSRKPLTIAAKYYYEDRRNGVEAFLKDGAHKSLRGSHSIYGESIFTKRGEVFGTYIFDTDASVKLNFSGSYHLQDSYYGSDFYKATQKIVYADLTRNLMTGRHDIIMGLSGRYNLYDDNTVATESLDNGHLINKPQKDIIPGIFVQDEYRVTPYFTILGGARLDYYTNHGLIMAPRLNAKYKPSGWTAFRLNFGTGFRTVNLFTEDHAFITGQRSVVIEETLNPEESYNFSFNFNHIYSALGGTGSIDIESYYTHFTNKIIPDYDDPQKIVYANSDGYAVSRGIGISINHSFEFPFSISTGFTLQQALEKESTNNDAEKIEFAPDWSGMMAMNYLWRNTGITVAYSASFTGPMRLPEVYDVDASGQLLKTPRSIVSETFAIHNIQISKPFSSGLTIYGGIQNLFDFKQPGTPLVGYNDPNSPVGFSPYFDTAYAYAPNHGREYYLGIKWDL